MWPYFRSQKAYARVNTRSRPVLRYQAFSWSYLWCLALSADANFGLLKASKKGSFFSFKVQNLETVRGYESANNPFGSTHEYYQTPYGDPVWAYLSAWIFFWNVKKWAFFDALKRLKIASALRGRHQRYDQEIAWERKTGRDRVSTSAWDVWGRKCGHRALF